MRSRRDDLDGAIEQVVAVAFAVEQFGIVVVGVFVRLFGDVAAILRRALRLQHVDDALDFGVGDERPVQTADAPAAGHEQQVALAEQLFGALLAEDGAASRSSR